MGSMGTIISTQWSLGIADGSLHDGLPASRGRVPQQGATLSSEEPAVCKTVERDRVDVARRVRGTAACVISYEGA